MYKYSGLGSAVINLGSKGLLKLLQNSVPTSNAVGSGALGASALGAGGYFTSKMLGGGARTNVLVAVLSGLSGGAVGASLGYLFTDKNVAPPKKIIDESMFS